VKPIAVLGTGMAGLGAGYILEQASVPFVCYDKRLQDSAHALGLPGLTDRAAALCRDKHEMRQRLARAGIPSPRQ